MARYLTIEPREKRKLGFGSHDATRTDEFTLVDSRLTLLTLLTFLTLMTTLILLTLLALLTLRILSGHSCAAVPGDAVGGG
jgi:hypothetical protein